MDYVRSCYKSKMALFSDRPDILTDGAWHFCEDDAILANMPHIFASSIWDEAKNPLFPSVGEVGGFHAWFNGAPVPRFVGQHFCGTPFVWNHGLPFADRPGLALEPDGTPTCCHAPPAVRIEASGGDLEIEGISEDRPVFIGAKARAVVPFPLAPFPFRVSFTSVLWDTDAFFDLDADPQKISPPRDGVYLVGVQAEWQWFPPATGTPTVQVRVRHAAGDALFELQGVLNQGVVDTLAQQSPAAESRLYEAFPANVELFVIGSTADLASLVVHVWLEWRADPPPVLFPLVTEAGDQLVTGDGDSLMGET